MTDRAAATTRNDAESWREYRDPYSLPPHRCEYCGQPIEQTHAMLADARRFCSSACYESWVRR